MYTSIAMEDEEGRRGFDVALSRLVMPYTLLGLVVFVAMTAMLESGQGIGQRIAFGVVALLVNLAEVALMLRLMVLMWRRRLWTRNSPLPSVDSFFGLIVAWGIGGMAFWVIDTSPTKTGFFAPIDTSGVYEVSLNPWIAAVEFTSNGLEHAAGAMHTILPVHVLSSLYYAFLTSVHYFFLAALIAVGFAWLFEQRTEGKPEKRGRSSPPKELNEFGIIGADAGYRRLKL